VGWQATEDVLGIAAKISIGKESCTIVGDGRAEDAVKARVKQIKNLIAETEQDYEREKLNERVARLSGGVAIIQVKPALGACVFVCVCVCGGECVGGCVCGSNGKHFLCHRTATSLRVALCSCF
jgi:hypothetical protein